MSKHTDGPWDYDYFCGHVAFSSKQHTEDYFMRVTFSDCVESPIWNGEGMPPEDVANIRLITAAPELLEALEDISQHAYDDETPNEHIREDFDRMRDIAYKAINKLKG